MSKSIYDALADQALLVPLGTSLTASVTYPGIRCSPTLLGTAMWVIAVTTISDAGTVVFLLETSSQLASGYVELTRFVWPTGETTPRQVQVGIAASLAAILSAQHQYLRVRVTTTGSPGAVWGSWIGKPGGTVGLGLHAGASGVNVP